jgi:hypothetical protein
MRKILKKWFTYACLPACLFATRNVATNVIHLKTLPNTIFQQDRYLANQTSQFLQTSGKEIINQTGPRDLQIYPQQRTSGTVSALAQPSIMLDQFRTRL